MVQLLLQIATFLQIFLTDVETLKEQVRTSSTSYLDTTREHREDISQNLRKINYMSGNKIPALESDISENAAAFNDVSVDKIPAIILGVSTNTSSVNDTSKIPPIKPDINDVSVDKIPMYKYK